MKHKKVLLQINSVVNSGSTGRIAEEIGQTAISKGWESYIAYARNDRPSNSKLIKIGNYYDIVIHGIQTRIFDRHCLSSKKATLDFVEKLKQIDPDIIHLHNLHGYYINIEILFEYLLQKNIPVVWTFHDCWAITGHCPHFDYVGCTKWRSECHHCPQKKKYPASWLMDRSFENFHLKKELFTSLKKCFIVTVSEWLSRIVKESYLANFPLMIINNGVNTELFRPIHDTTVRNRYNLKNKFVILGVASGWNARKGLFDFIELSKSLSTDHQIILIGLNNSQIRKLPARILGLERTENLNELVKLYNAADVFINPTWEDNFPTTNLESLSCGTPVITYKTGGSIESLDINTGFIIPKGDISGLIKAISTIKLKGKEYFAKPCVERAKVFYDKNNRYLDYIKLYESLLG